MIFLIYGMAIIIIFILSLQDWKLSLKTVLYLIVIEGALRKWVFPQASDLIYFVKDIVLIGAYFQYFIFRKSSKFSFKITTFNVLFLLIIFWSIFQSFNPSLGSPIIGVFGLRSYIFYIPIIWMLRDLFDSETELKNNLLIYLLTAIPLGILGSIQFFSSPDSFINISVGDEMGVGLATPFGLVTRVSGTFSYLAGYEAYLTVCFIFLVLFLFQKISLKWRILIYVEFFLVLINSLMTGSRSVIFASLLWLLGYAVIKVIYNPTFANKILKKAGLPVLIVVITSIFLFQPVITAFAYRTTTNSDLGDRIQKTFIDPIEWIQFKQLDGYGTGATQVGGEALRRNFNLPEGETIPIYFEEEPGRVMLELGPIGFSVWYGLRITLIISLWRVYRKLKRPFLRDIALGMFLLHTINIYDQLITHATFLLYYWFTTGFIFMLPKLEKLEKFKQEQIQQQKNAYASYYSQSSYW